MKTPSTLASRASIFRFFALIALTTAPLALSGCAVIGDIFKAGVWVGVLVIIGLLAVVGGGLAMFRR